MNLQKRSLSPGLILWATTVTIAPILVIGEVTPQSFLNPHLLNLFAAVVVFIHGLAALTAIWRMERSNAHGTIPFAWAFFAVQHLAFGFGALLIVVFDDDYYYGNELGTYAFSGSVLPLLLVQFVAMSMAMLGVWLATGRRSWWVRKPAGMFPASTSLSWEVCQVVCIAGLFLHALIWIVLPRIQALSAFSYLPLAFGGAVSSTFVIWGLAWPRCRQRWIFVTYGSAFAMLQVVQGNRSYFMFPALLFAIGLLLSHGGKWRLKVAVRMIPIAIVFLYAFLKSEDIRTVFSRGNPSSAAEAVQRFELLGGNDAYTDRLDATGAPMNGPFRIGSRLFELSAADVIAKTPSAVPYWGWTGEDWKCAGHELSAHSS